MKGITLTFTLRRVIGLDLIQNPNIVLFDEVDNRFLYGIVVITIDRCKNS
mgnify:CR=1 FL=1